MKKYEIEWHYKNQDLSEDHNYSDYYTNKARAERDARAFVKWNKSNLRYVMINVFTVIDKDYDETEWEDTYCI